MFQLPALSLGGMFVGSGLAGVNYGGGTMRGGFSHRQLTNSPVHSVYLEGIHGSVELKVAGWYIFLYI